MSETLPESGPRKLPLRRILFGAFVLPWANRGAVMRATSLPLLLIVAAVLAWHTSSFGESKTMAWITWGFFVLSLTWLAITVHRLVLANGWQPRSAFTELRLRRFLYFVGALVFLWMLYQATVLLLMSLALNFLHPPRYVPTGEAPPQRLPFDLSWLSMAAAIGAYWLIGRISLILPAIAIDQKPNIGDAWRVAQRNGWKIAIVVGALPWTLEQLTNLLWREGATTFEVASLGILTGVCMIVQVVALSLSYYELTHASAPPPTHPPG